MWFTLLLGFLKPFWAFFTKHWLGVLCTIAIVVLGAMVYFKDQTIKKQQVAVTAAQNAVVEWEKSYATISNDLIKQNAAIEALKQAGLAYQQQIKDSQAQIATITKSYDEKYQWLLKHPAPTTCTGAMDYLLNAAIHNKGKGK